MLKNLIIVESPEKAGTIGKFLGKDYKVMASVGHIRDLAKKNFGIDINDNFRPVYEISEDKKSLVAELRKAAKQAETVWLASDDDFEGEAIAWHLSEVLKLKPENTHRIVCHEITKEAFMDALKHPRAIDFDRVDAQQARRVLDRIVGFELSPVLWKKIKPALSAGRVQSVAVRLIVDRENEIRNFKPQPYVRVSALFATADGSPVRAELGRRLADLAEAEKLMDACKTATFTVSDVQQRPVHRAPAAPFSTSTLLQEAARKLNFTASQTMMVAQRLYEQGLITYMRTDSFNLSQQALNGIAAQIKATMGDRYLKLRKYQTRSKGAQEAHEAIRPTQMDRRTVDGTSQEKRLYNLIWKRTLASQMADAEFEKTQASIDISGSGEHFTASGEVMTFDGFLRLWDDSRNTLAPDTDEEENEGISRLAPLTTGQTLERAEIQAVEKLTKQPARYDYGTMVKKLEELGIGRPSTYATIISTIQQRGYIEAAEIPGTVVRLATLTMERDGDVVRSEHDENIGADAGKGKGKSKFVPTDIGIIVNRFLTEYFPKILDYNFTAGVEEKIDRIAAGEMRWNDEIRTFYDDFHPEVENASNMRLEHKVGERVLGTDPNTGKQVSVKIGKFGPLVQIGTTEEDEKPLFASLLKGQSVETLTLEEALKLFEYPKKLGDFEDKEVTVAIGRFGPYVRHDGKFVSIPKGEDPAAVTLDRAIELIREKRQAQANRIVRTFDQNPALQILNGRYGIYISCDGANYKIPKTVTDPASLTYEQAMEIVGSQDSKPKRPRRPAARKK